MSQAAMPMARFPGAIVVGLLATGFVLGATELMSESITGTLKPVVNCGQLLSGLLAFRIAAASAPCFDSLVWPRSSVLIGIVAVGCLVAGLIGGVSWPNSGDEYSYAYLAEAFRAGRLWTPPPPDTVLFEQFHILVSEGRTFSPYPPAWSAILVPFLAGSALWLANPVMTILLGVCLAGAARLLSPDPAIRRPALALALVTPFTMFLGGSLFPHTTAGALTAAVVWVQLTDEQATRRWCKPLIGALMGCLLLVRYEVFAIVAFAYVAERLWVRKTAVFTDAAVIVVGFLPFAICLAVYSRGVTGVWGQLTTTWASSIEADPIIAQSVAIRMLDAAARELYWLGNLAEFGGLPILIVGASALLSKLRNRTLRFYDALFPLSMVFYLLQPFGGGHQYGPRYWFPTWTLLIFTVITGLPNRSSKFSTSQWYPSMSGLTAGYTIISLASFPILLIFTHTYIQTRREVFDLPHMDGPSVVLLPDRSLKAWPWPASPIPASNLDFTRNGINFDQQVLFGRDGLPASTSRACGLGGRAVFRWRGPGQLEPIPCLLPADLASPD